MAKDVEKSIQSVSLIGKNPLASVLGKPWNFKPTIKYDDIVDDSNFRSSAETKRDMIASGKIGAGEQGVYDYQENEKITSENLVSDVEIALRSGKLDKADVQKLQEMYAEKGADDVQSAREKQALEKENAKSKNRLKELDDKLGINQEE